MNPILTRQSCNSTHGFWGLPGCRWFSETMEAPGFPRHSTPVRRRRPLRRNCDYCGKPYEAKRITSKFCSRASN
jgi:hypothetical protein